MTILHDTPRNSSGQDEARRTGLTLRRRAALLVACVAFGSAIGWLGARFGGSDAWYLAIPACMALVWLFIADPSQCSMCEVEPEKERVKHTR